MSTQGDEGQAEASDAAAQGAPPAKTMEVIGPLSGDQANSCEKDKNCYKVKQAAEGGAKKRRRRRRRTKKRKTRTKRRKTRSKRRKTKKRRRRRRR